jgi:hypothetical protein
VETFVLGAGLGLLSVASIVGAQSTVSWGQRGVVTGTVMFCRYLGQSLGAAIFGAIFNAALSGKAHTADAIATATTHVYAALTVVAALTIAAVLLIMPKHFSTAAGQSASTGPAEAGPVQAGPAGAGPAGAGPAQAGAAEKPE